MYFAAFYYKFVNLFVSFIEINKTGLEVHTGSIISCILMCSTVEPAPLGQQGRGCLFSRICHRGVHMRVPQSLLQAGRSAAHGLAHVVQPRQ